LLCTVIAKEYESGVGPPIVPIASVICIVSALVPLGAKMHSMILPWCTPWSVSRRLAVPLVGVETCDAADRGQW